jgi:hypothetical protein
VEYFLISLLDPVLVVPCLAVGYFLRGPLRLYLGAAILAGFPILGLGYAGSTPPSDVLWTKGLATAFALMLGYALSRLRSKSRPT